MTKNREDYIKTIFQFEESNTPVSNKLLAETLNVTPASASQMISKLVDSELVSYNSGIITLTEAATIIAKDIVSKHRLWESLLLQHLDYQWDDVHEEAEMLEHVTSDLLVKKLNKFLNYPKFCPHGGAIYINEDSQSNGLITLKNLELNESAIIKRFTDDKQVLLNAKDLELNIGDVIRLIKIDDFNNQMIVKNSDRNIILSFNIVNQIFVEVVKEDD